MIEAKVDAQQVNRFDLQFATMESHVVRTGGFSWPDRK
jgi:hypothetical protein